MRKRDDELYELMASLEADSSLSWTKKLQRVIDFKKDKRGLKGIHFSVYPDDPSKTTNDTVAHDIFMMEKACADGKYVDVTYEPL